MRKIFLVIPLIIFIIVITFIIFLTRSNPQNILSPIGQNNILKIEKPLEKYTFERLRNRVSIPSNIEIGAELKNTNGFAS